MDEIFENGAKLYAITDKGREATRIFEKQLPYPVREAAQRSALRVVRQIRRDAGDPYLGHRARRATILTVRMEMEQVFAIEMSGRQPRSRQPCSSAPSKPTPKRSTRSCSAL
ncbi:MAG: DUF4364 family protein [Butyricicoccaceae bacterium]